MSIKNSENCPYYSTEFFEVIKAVKNSESLNIRHLSIGMWYRALLKLYVLTETDENGFVFTLTPKVELRNPGVDWATVWKFASNSFLDSDDSSFLFRCLHNLLPTQKFLAKIDRNNSVSEACNLCDLNEVDSKVHFFFQCPFNRGVGLWLINCVRKICPTTTADDILVLRFSPAIEVKDAEVTTWVIAKVLNTIWLSRRQKKETDVTTVRAKIESSIMILRKSRHAAMVSKIENLI